MREETFGKHYISLHGKKKKNKESKMRDLNDYDYSMIKKLMEEYKPKPVPTGVRRSVRYKPIKEHISIPKSPSQAKLLEQVAEDIYRQAASKSLTVSLSSLEIYRNDITKKVKMLDVKLSFSYQEDFATQTIRLEKQLVRHGNKWTWVNDDGSRTVITFPYFPGDRVNLNVGIFIHKTKKHGLFGKDTITTQVGTAAECIVLAKDKGVGMGLPIGNVISQNIRLNFDLNGRGHKLTMKLKLDLEKDLKGPPMMWLRPKSSDKRFRSSKWSLDLLRDLPPKDKDEDARVKIFIFNNQRFVNYQRGPVLECRSLRPAVCETEIPSGIELRQVITGNTLAYLVPVVKTIDKTSVRYRLAILVVTAEGPNCLCSAKWKSSDKFDYKIYMFKTGETFGQRIKWATKDFIDISYAILNSTGHQIVMRPDSETLIEDVCIGLCLKLLVRWSSEPLPWKQNSKAPMSDCHKYLTEKYTENGTDMDFSGDIKDHMANLGPFIDSQDLMVFTDVEEFMVADRLEDKDKMILVRSPSTHSYETCSEPKHGVEKNIEDMDDEDDEVDATTVSSKVRYECDWDELTTSGFIDERSEYTGGGSWIDSVL